MRVVQDYKMVILLQKASLIMGKMIIRNHHYSPCLREIASAWRLMGGKVGKGEGLLINTTRKDNTK